MLIRISDLLRKYPHALQSRQSVYRLIKAGKIKAELHRDHPTEKGRWMVDEESFKDYIAPEGWIPLKAAVQELGGNPRSWRRRILEHNLPKKYQGREAFIRQSDLEKLKNL